MTEKLKDLLHERAAAVDFDLPDLASLTRDGDRRMRRRRGAVVLGVAAAATVAVAVPLGLSGGDGGAQVTDSPPAQSDVPFPRGPITWASGETIHYGDRTLDVGRPVEAFVATTYGFVVASGGEVFQVDGSEQVFKVGEIDRREPRLVSDEDGPLAAWVQSTRNGPAFVVNDLEENSTSVQSGPRPAGNPADPEIPPSFYALDGSTAYWRDSRGAVAVALSGGESEIIEADPEPSYEIFDVADGVIARTAEDFLQSGGTTIGRAGEEGLTLPEVYNNAGALSPDGAWYSADADEVAVIDTATGEPVTFDLPGFSTGYGWLTDDTLAVLAAPDTAGQVQLLTCTVPDAECDVAVPDLGTFEEIGGDFVLPVGQRS